MNLPKVKITHAAVKVSSVQKSMEFLQKALSLKAAWSGQEDWGMLKANGSTLALIEKNHEVHPPHIGFVVDKKEEVDQVFEHLKSIGLKEIQEPKDHRDRSRSFYFKDPDGNQFELLWLPDALSQ